MFCCRGREKRSNGEEKTISRKEMVERYILSSCKQNDEDSIDQSMEKSNMQIIDFDNNQYEKRPWSSAQWQMTIQTKSITQIDSEELKKNVRFGILQNLRPATWFWLTDIQQRQISKHNANIYVKLKSYESQYDTAIFKCIKLLEKKYSDTVFDILRAYANYDVEIGFVKGMDQIVEYLLHQLDPEQYLNLDYAYNQMNRISDFYEQMVFWMTVHILFELNYRQMFKFEISFTQNEKFDNTLMPSIKSLLSQLNLKMNKIIEMPLLFWFQKFLKKDQYSRLFDAFIFEGETVLLQMLLKLLKISENIICMFQTESDLKTYINQSMIPYGISQIEKSNQKLMNFLL